MKIFFNWFLVISIFIIVLIFVLVDVSGLIFCKDLVVFKCCLDGSVKKLNLCLVNYIEGMLVYIVFE